VLTDLGAEVAAAALQSDGRIVVAGYSLVSGVDVALARYNVDGSLDVSFGGDGTVVVDLGAGEGDAALDVVVQSDGKIVIAGVADPPGPGGDSEDFLLARFDPDGGLDTQGLDPYLDAPFGTAGKVTTDFAGTSDEAWAIGIEAGGRLVVTGLTIEGGFDRFAVARYDVDGSLDQTFGAGGKITTDFAGDASALDVAIQANGSIVAAGHAFVGGVVHFALARYLTQPCCIVGVGNAGVP
jgi:uncharacterized delta-60 repeat protein